MGSEDDTRLRPSLPEPYVRDRLPAAPGEPAGSADDEMEITYRAQLCRPSDRVACKGGRSMEPGIPSRPLGPNQRRPRESCIGSRGIQALVGPRGELEEMKLAVHGVDPGGLAVVHAYLLEHPCRERQEAVADAVPSPERGFPLDVIVRLGPEQPAPVEAATDDHVVAGKKGGDPLLASGSSDRDDPQPGPGGVAGEYTRAIRGDGERGRCVGRRRLDCAAADRPAPRRGKRNQPTA